MITTKLWEKYNEALRKVELSNRTSNVVGDYAEDLVAKALNGDAAKTSTKGYDVSANGKRIQVKATRQNWPKLRGNTSDIRHEDFEELVGVIFDKDGEICKVVKVSLEEARQLKNKRDDSSWLISWSKLAKRGKDITPLFLNIVV